MSGPLAYGFQRASQVRRCHCSPREKYNQLYSSPSQLSFVKITPLPKSPLFPFPSIIIKQHKSPLIFCHAISVLALSHIPQLHFSFSALHNSIHFSRCVVAWAAKTKLLATTTHGGIAIPTIYSTTQRVNTSSEWVNMPL